VRAFVLEVFTANVIGDGFERLGWLRPEETV
jgi:hypothetical protein